MTLEVNRTQEDLRRARERLARSMGRLTIGAVRSYEERKAQRAVERLTEREEQVVIEISGRATARLSWGTRAIKFGTLFVYATGERDSTLIRPHFTFGSSMEYGGPVGVHAQVIEWEISNRDETTGCTLAVGVVSNDSRDYRGELHTRFQGYGMPVDDFGDVAMYDIG